MAELIGQQFGDYILTDLVGRGPFSDVYQAKHRYLSTIVAIKISREQQPDHKINLYRRAYIQGRLIHPYILHILYYNNQDVPFLVMDLASHSLSQSLLSQHSPVEPTLTLSLIRQIADGLDYAHSQRIVHGNLKLENILFNKQGVLLLSDFDVSTYFPSQNRAALDSLHYIAPEQREGKTQPASDQYVLACLTYEWLSGQSPYVERGSHVLKTRLTTTSISRSTEEVFKKALSQDARQRYETVKDFVIALEQAMGMRQPEQRQLPILSQPSRPRAKRLPLGIFILLVILVSSGLFASQLVKTPAASSTAPIATRATDPMDLYAALTKKQPSFSDTPGSHAPIHWVTYTERVGAGCKLMGNNLHLTLSKSDMITCLIRNPNQVRDFAFQIQMIILQGGDLESGLLLRSKPDGVEAYRFVLDTVEYMSNFQVIGPNGAYASKSSDGSSAIKSSLQQANTFTCIAHDHTFYLYINGAFIGDSPKRDNTYQDGSIGVVALTGDSTPMHIVFSNAKVWI